MKRRIKIRRRDGVRQCYHKNYGGFVLLNSAGERIKKGGVLTPYFEYPAQASRYADKEGMDHAVIWQTKNYGSLYHGTSEESLARMPLTGGLAPRGGKLYLTDDLRYARFKASQSGKPVVIEVDDPGDVVREGRHFVSRKTIPSREFKRVMVTI